MGSTIGKMFTNFRRGCDLIIFVASTFVRTRYRPRVYVPTQIPNIDVHSKNSESSTWTGEIIYWLSVEGSQGRGPLELRGKGGEGAVTCDTRPPNYRLRPLYRKNQNQP